MITRLPAALVVSVCATACVSSYNNPRPAPPPPPAASTPASGAGQPQANAPAVRQDPKWQDTKPKEPEQRDPNPDANDADASKPGVKHLEVAIEGKSRSHLAGKVELTDVPGGVKVVIHVKNIKPGPHGVHIHEVADCSANDAESAGAHFNPENMHHALPSEKERHLGDLGNIIVEDPGGKGHLEIVVPRANLKVGARRSLLDRALVVHADADDGKRQPGGNSGARIGCAELTIKAGESKSGKIVMAE